MQHSKEEASLSSIVKMFDELSEGVVVVEGNHDAAVMKLFGVSAMTHAQLFKNGLKGEQKTVYVLTDRDKGGEEKRHRITSFLLERYPRSRINENAGRRLLRIANATSVEQIYAPIVEAMKKGMDERRKNKKNW